MENRLTFDEVLGQLEKVRQSGKDPQGNPRYSACCPAHADRSPSLCISEDARTGRLLLYCFAGCSFDDILNHLTHRTAHRPPRNIPIRPIYREGVKVSQEQIEAEIQKYREQLKGLKRNG